MNGSQSEIASFHQTSPISVQQDRVELLSSKGTCLTEQELTQLKRKKAFWKAQHCRAVEREKKVKDVLKKAQAKIRDLQHWLFGKNKRKSKTIPPDREDSKLVCDRCSAYKCRSRLLDTDWIKESYYISDINCSTFIMYGVVLLSKMPTKRLFLHPLTSLMGRNVVIAEYEINEQKLLAATVHWESFRHSVRVRAVQLEKIFLILNSSDSTVLMGDFNFCSSWDENRNIDSSCTDLWPALRGDEPGYTEDTDINLMRMQLKREEKKVRFDRIIYRSSIPGWRPKKKPHRDGTCIPEAAGSLPSGSFRIARCV